MSLSSKSIINKNKMNAAEDDDYQSIGSELPLDEETSSVSPHNDDQVNIVVKDSEINGQQSNLTVLYGEPYSSNVLT